MMFDDVVVLENELRQPGVFIGEAVWVPAEATYVTAVMSDRDKWLQFGVDETVVELIVEVNVDGMWKVLGGCTTDASKFTGKDGKLKDKTTLSCVLPRDRIPVPQVRGVLRCASPCEGAVTLVFDDAPVSRRVKQEHHSVTYDNDGEATSATTVSSITIGAFAVGNNTDRCMVVGAVAYAGTAANNVVSTISHNGSTTGWASVISRVGPAGNPNNRSSMWRKVAPDVATVTVVVTMVGVCDELGVNATSVYGVDQTTPMGTGAGADGVSTDPTATVNVSAATGDMVYDAVYAYGSGTFVATAGASQTPRANTLIEDYGGNAKAYILASTEPGATTVTMSWTLTGGNTEWVTVACAIKASAGAAAASLVFLRDAMKHMLVR